MAGQIISTVGTWMQSVAMPWLALQLTHSGLLVGLVLAAQFTPVLLGGPFGGLVADRFRKRSVLLVTQSLFTVPSFALFALSSSGHAQYWMVILAAVATGTVNMFDVPARQSVVIEMVGRKDLMNAIALNSSVFNGAAVVGPSVAGVIIAAVGVPICFLANSVSYPAAGRRATPGPGLGDPGIAGLLIRAAGARCRVAVGGCRGLLALRDESPDADAPIRRPGVACRRSRFGFLVGSMGLGALTGALTLAFFPSLGANPRRQLWMAMIWVAALLEFSISRVFIVSVVALLVAGFCQVSFVAASNSRIQTLTPDHLRGRVMGLYAQALIGVTPIGSTQAGALATLFGAPWAMAIGAVIAGAVVIGIWLARPEVFSRLPTGGGGEKPGQPSQTSKIAARASAGTSQRSART